ncbi:MAG: tRNA (adenosine(37)-N6)-dimethylallyltransferase MiaA [Clostridia bacterium]|nr:tRNA (adenosine(37)-N6)-dimethylallyltransferase MiaA [Clostridia bacterium]
MCKPKVVVIGGPTASGKTALSIALAKKINGEIISADSMQIYKDMSIGTAKPTIEEMDGIKHYLVDWISPEIRYSVADFKKDAIAAIDEILSKGKTPIVVGGTGLYIDSLIFGIDYNEINVDLEYRKYLQNLIDEKGLEYVYNLAKDIDEKAMKKISINDKKRICRVLEIYKSTGKNKTEMEAESKKNGINYDFRVFAIDMDREVLYNRINRRVDFMIEAGLIEEVANLIKKYPSMPTAMQGLGYKEVIEYFEKKCSKEEMIEKIKQESRRYAKRQLTWFRRNKEIKWIDASNSLDENIDFIIEEIR